MANLVVGSKDCSFNDIVKIFEEQAIYTVKFDWTKLALWLGTPRQEELKCRTALKTETMKYRDVIKNLIVDWKSRKATEATINHFLQCIPIDWEQVKVFVRKLIIKKAVSWDDLDTHTQNAVLKSNIVFMSRECTLESLRVQIEGSTFNKIVRDFLEKAVFVKMLENEIWKLDSNILPQRLPYYVTRSLTMFCKLNEGFFKEICTDIFVIEGIEPHRLTIFAEPEAMDTSENQVELVDTGVPELTVRFILLDAKNSSDFYEILKLTNKPVHRIKFENDTFYWMSTRGSIQVISTYLLNEGEDITEDNFVTKNLAEFNSRPVAICGSPGMGKSVLLNSLANQVKEIFKDRYVAFLKLRDLAECFNNFNDQVDLSVVKANLAELLMNHTLGKLILVEMLNNKSVKFELFLDGFDEVSMETFAKAQTFLKFLLESENIRIHITSRLHMQEELQSLLGVISQHIAPISREDQLNLICGYWKNSTEIITQENLHQVGQTVLEQLDQINGPDNLNKHFGEIPLQCFMLAKVYLNVAKRYQSSENARIPNPTKSLCDLYKEYMDDGFERVANEDKKIVKTILWSESLKLLFPDSPEVLNVQEALAKNISNSGPFSLNKVWDVGILEAHEKTDKIVFLHRTFAEYLLAEFIVEELVVNRTFQNDVWTNFVYEAVLAIRTQNAGMKCVLGKTLSNIGKLPEFRQGGGNMNLSNLQQVVSSQSEQGLALWNNRQQFEHSHWQAFLLRTFMSGNFEEIHDIFHQSFENNVPRNEFEHGSICFFINGKLSKQHNIIKTTTLFNRSLKAELDSENHKTVLVNFLIRVLICTSMCYKHVMHLLINMLQDSANIQQWLPLDYEFYQLFYTTAAQSDNVEFFKWCIQTAETLGAPKLSEMSFRKSPIRDSEYEHTPIHEAVFNGNYKIFGYLSTVYNERVHTMVELWHICWLASWQNTNYTISNKVELLRLFKIKNVDIILNTLDKCIMPGIHVDLFITVCEIFNYQLDKKDINFLRNFVINFCRNDSQMNRLVDWFVKNKLAWLLVHLDSEQNSLLTSALCFNVLKPETIVEVYKSHPFDLGIFLHYKKIWCWYKRLDIWLEAVEKLPGSVDVTSFTRNFTLHQAARARAVQIIKYLLSVGMKVNSQNNDGDTPLHCVFLRTHLSETIHLIHDCVEICLDNGADVFIKNGDGNTALYYAACMKERLNVEDKTVDLLKSKVHFSSALVSVSFEDFAQLKEKVNWKSLFQLYNCPPYDLIGLFRDAAFCNCCEILVKVLSDLFGNVNITDEQGHTMLHCVAYWRNIDAMKYLLSKGADVNLKDESGDTALHCIFFDTDCVENIYNIHACVQLLIENKADVCAKSKNGTTPLYFAANHKNVLQIQEETVDLLKNGIQFSSNLGICGHEFTILKNNLRLKSLSEVFNLLPFNLHQVFHEAVMNDCGEIVAKAIVGLSQNVNLADRRNATILHAAAYSRDINAIKFLISKGANVNLKDANGDTPLHCIFQRTNWLDTRRLIPKCIELLVENRANVCSRNIKGDTILIRAAVFRNENYIGDTTIDLLKKSIKNNCVYVKVSDEEFEVLKILLHWESFFQIYDLRPFNLSASFRDAMSWNCSEILVKVTIGLTGYVDLMDAHRATFLHYAAYLGNLSVMKLLVSMGANVNSRDVDGDTPLHWIFDWNGRTRSELGRSLNLRNDWIHDCVQTLVDNNANVCAKNRTGLTPLSNALHWKQIMKIENRTIELLIQELSTSISPNIKSHCKDDKAKIRQGGAKSHGKHFVMKKKSRKIDLYVACKIYLLVKRIHFLASELHTFSGKSLMFFYLICLLHFKCRRFLKK